MQVHDHVVGVGDGNVEDDVIIDLCGDEHMEDDIIDLHSESD
jgi:hypothetical protein